MLLSNLVPTDDNVGLVCNECLLTTYQQIKVSLKSSLFCQSNTFKNLLAKPFGFQVISQATETGFIKMLNRLLPQSRTRLISTN